MREISRLDLGDFGREEQVVWKWNLNLKESAGPSQWVRAAPLSHAKVAPRAPLLLLVTAPAGMHPFCKQVAATTPEQGSGTFSVTFPPDHVASLGFRNWDASYVAERVDIPRIRRTSYLISSVGVHDPMLLE
ncbi:uncharacterized protein VTP21DRAFT_2793 [Calcarisporiella thermophila]|uniref:uncharacterized protein n=1 Tax=Calcarisporiella thermophila TaxID=911321 RepID=UPI003744008F